MRKDTITDAEAQQLLAGQAPAGRPELAELAASFADVRRVALESAPQPSAALAARLDQPSLGVSAGAASTPKGIKKMFEWISGLGVAAKVAVGTTVLALGLTGVGAAGALPGPVQSAFDGVVTSFAPSEDEVLDDEIVDDCTVEDDTEEGEFSSALLTDGVGGEGENTGGETGDGTDEGTDEVIDECAAEEVPLPVGSKEFSSWVVQGAQDPNKIGSEFGAAVSEQARELKDENAALRAGAKSGDDVDDEDEDDVLDETGDESEKTSNRGGNSGNNGGGRP